MDNDSDGIDEKEHFGEDVDQVIKFNETRV